MEENSTDSPLLHFDDGFVIWKINNKYAKPYIPAMVFVGVILLVGVPGNGLVLYVYHFVFRNTTANLCIRFLALMDVICLCLGAPVELLDMRFPIMYGHVITCSVLRTIELNAGFASSCMLICITYDRYNHICKPLKVFVVRKMYRIIVVIAIIATTLTAPLFVLFGPQSMIYAGITTKGCSFDDRVKNTRYPFVYFTCLAVLSTAGLCIIIALDIMIAVAIRRWQRKTIGEQVKATSVHIIPTTTSAIRVSMSMSMPPRRIDPRAAQQSTDASVIGSAISNSEIPSNDAELTRKYECLTSLFGSLCEACATRIAVRSITTGSSWKQDTTFESGRGGGEVRAPAPRCGQQSRRKTRTTLILCSVSIVFVLTYTPYLLTEILVNAGVVAIDELPFVGQQLWEVANKSYFISTAANPFIYASLNPAFRNECVKLFTNIRTTSRYLRDQVY